jgi:hypothetical protein
LSRTRFRCVLVIIIDACRPKRHLLFDWIDNFWLYTSNLCHNTKPIQILSLINLTINIYNLTPVESNSDKSKFRLSRIKVLVQRCRKLYHLHSLSQIYLSKHVYYLRIKIGSQVKHPVIEFRLIRIRLNRSQIIYIYTQRSSGLR